MIRVNNTDFKVYDLDTPVTFTERIAAELHTLPKYLYFPEPVPQVPSEARSLNVDDLLDEIKENARISTNFSEFLNTIRDRIPEELDITKDILYVWLAFNTEIQRQKTRSQTAFEKIGNDLQKDGYFLEDRSFANFWRLERKGIKTKLNREIESNALIVAASERLYETLGAIDDGLLYLPLKTENVTLRVRLSLLDTSILELFNDLILSENAPFATSQQYYKILKDFVPPEDWEMSPSESLLLKVSEKQRVNTSNFDEYSDVIFSHSEEDRLHATMKINMGKGNLNRAQFLERIMNSFNSSEAIQYDNAEETRMSAVFYFPAERINSYVFGDLVMTDPLFSFLILIDESKKATKRRSERGLPALNIHFEHPSVGRISARITQQIVEQNDATVRGMSKQIAHLLEVPEDDHGAIAVAREEIFPIGSPYIRVLVTRGRDKQSIEKFQEIFSKLLVMYKQKYREIVDIYREYIPDFGAVEKVVIRKLDMSVPKNAAPEVFVTKYTRNCEASRMPTVVTKAEARKLKATKKPVMLFPRDKPDTGTVYPSDGKNQHYYVCNNPEFPYPGLQNNKLTANSEDYPFVPCCFSAPQTSKPAWKQYYKGAVIPGSKTGKSRQQDHIKTDKILDSGQYGYLPKKLDALFQLMDPSTEYSYLRIGVHRNKSSFLNAVMVALDEQTGILELTDDDEREARLNDVRDTELATPENAATARQSLYDATVSSIQNKISDPDVYLDPNLYLQLLENQFDCNIFLFNRAKLLLPRHLQIYYSDKRLNRPCVFIYEHWGGESDYATYPQCEVIVRWQVDTTDLQYVFPYGQRISRGVRQTFALLRQSYILDKPSKQTEFPLSDELIITAQRIDSYGKCRQLQVEHVNTQKEFSLLVEPIAPRVGTENTDAQLIYSSLTDAIAILNDRITSQTVVDDVLKEVTGVIGNVNVTIPVQDDVQLPDIPVRSDMSHLESQESTIAVYNYNKKMARYLTEYIYWLFSMYLHKAGIETIDDDVLDDFAQNYVVVKPDFVYGHVRKKFSRKGGVMDNRKLVVVSEEMRRRLMYVLKMYSMRDVRSLLNYREKKVIQNYYQDITDFKTGQNQVILYGENSIEKWIQESKTFYKLYDGVFIGNRAPYFFKNALVGDSVYLAQNIENLGKAISIGLTWSRQGYNVSEHAKEHSLVNFTLYRYLSPSNIRIYRTTGSAKSTRLRIMGYKVDGTPFYTVLLPLS
jgi:hypothetical protein